MAKLQSSIERPLSFSGSVVEATLLNAPERYRLESEAYVVNPGEGYVAISEDPGHGIPPLSSSRLRKVHLSSPDPVILLRTPERRDASCIREEPGWQRFKLPVGSPLSSPDLWRSGQDEVATMLFSANATLPIHLRDVLGPTAAFALKLNLWFAPAGTHCLIHNQHEFVEIHTQVAGVGYMQKFHSESFDSLYEEVGMLPGFTTSQPFCVAQKQGGFCYPWHQYYAGTDCIWMAIEYHPPA
ncbi:hypothetical protein [Xanthomonas arboricola]|uniref:hypothetical protein n=1 Tax=Xanthomonas arboricola TaxID=56448 RepID=UPI002B2DAD92|nr:hypothetical protein X12_002404 [Xanthomonas arboricola]